MVVVSLGAVMHVANADPILWTLSTLTFASGGGGPELANGGIASGFFTYDADTNTYSNWNIDVSAFGAGFNQGNAVATPATSSIQPAFFGIYGPPGPTTFGLSYSSDQALLWLGFFHQPLTNSGGIVDVSATVLDAGNVFYSWYAGGTASAAAVPEPASVLLLLGGGVLCVICMFLHQRGFRRRA
jgi:hypothetical protein